MSLRSKRVDSTLRQFEELLFTWTHDMVKLSQTPFGTAIEPIEATLAVLLKEYYSSNIMPIIDSNSRVS